MARSARSSALKKNKSGLKKRVFGPVETARNERLNAKLLELAQQPKAPRPEMDVEEESASKATNSEAKAEQSMDVDNDAVVAKRRSSDKKSLKPLVNKIQKPKRRARNEIAFAPTGRARSKKGSKRGEFGASGRRRT
ncbi:hypothetical protein B0A54_02928 [Friedmanniomyces endolithicus]|uniref:DUF2423 domain-containing protein n=1 Tax=Friedmanniomyces endolithicus TaxID=329885 RepID=A0A4U0VAZ7_9PEZI|nr:hypothetical protein LTS09_005830 [Friedmanniomyces endolithicus]TKA46121.1 hypothetical protein B0A54_02928 [Friedmanniomyces endolithicus]